MVSKEAVHSICLVIRQGEEVTKSSTTEDDLLASTLGFEDGAVRVNLCCADSEKNISHKYSRSLRETVLTK